MVSQRVQVAVRLSALCTRMRSLAEMHGVYVPVHGPGGSECLGAVGAPVRPGSLVDRVLVQPEVATSGEAFAALGTLVWFFSCVYNSVLPPHSHVLELFAAVCAHMGFAYNRVFPFLPFFGRTVILCPLFVLSRSVVFIIG